jgi:hypothetical protein
MTQPRINPARRRSKTRRGPGPATHYRVWIASYKDWAPQGDHDVPPDVVASEPAEPGTMSAAQAARYVEAFNRAALARHRNLRAVALPVTLHYEGDPVPGQPLPAARFRPASRPARKKKPAACLSGVDTRRASTAGKMPNTSCGVPARTPSARQPHQTS